MDLTNRRAATKPLIIDVDGDKLVIRYRPKHLKPSSVRDLQESGRKLRDILAKASGTADAASAIEEVSTVDSATEEITPDAQEQARLASLAVLAELEAQLSGISDITDQTIEQTLEIVAEWNLVDEGVPVPLTRAGIIEHDVDIPLLSFVLAKIQEDQSVPTPSARSSAKRS